MKISVVGGFFLPVPPVAGGAMEKIWFRLAREFAAAGHEVSYFSRRWPGFPEDEVIDGIHMTRLRGFGHTRNLALNLTLDFIWGLRVARKLPKGDIVACNTVSLPAYLGFIRPSAGRTVAVLGRMPKGHGRFYGRVDRLIATSEAVRERLVLENPRLADRTRVFPNPIDWPLHQAEARQESGSGPITIGYVGRIHPEKGLDILIQAAAELGRRSLPAWRLRMIGPQDILRGGGGPEYVDGLKRAAAQAGGDIVFDPPIYDAGALAKAYGEISIFCYPSLAEKGEGLSVAPIEAMAAGAVPVVSALDCYRDVIREGGNGLVFDHRRPDRAAALADRLTQLLKDPVLRHRLRAGAMEDSKRFDFKTVARNVLEDFSALG